MSKSLKEFKRMNLEEKIKASLENWKKILVIVLTISFVSSGVSCVVYNAWNNITTDTETTRPYYDGTLHKVIGSRDIIIHEPTKKTLFILSMIMFPICLFFSAMYNDINRHTKGKSFKDGLYIIAYTAVKVFTVSLIGLIILYYLGSYVEPLIFG
jgi:hypothetical protein